MAVAGSSGHRRALPVDNPFLTVFYRLCTTLQTSDCSLEKPIVSHGQGRIWPLAVFYPAPVSQQPKAQSCPAGVHLWAILVDIVFCFPIASSAGQSLTSCDWQ